MATIYSEENNETIDGSDDADTIIIKHKGVEANGWDGNDKITGSSNNDRMLGMNGHDSLYGGIGADSLWGSGGDDLLLGNAGADQIFAGANNDQVLGGSENDKLYGQEGNDVLDGGTGADLMQGNDGNDTYYVDNVNDVVDETDYYNGTPETGVDTVKTTLSVLDLNDTAKIKGPVENLTFIGAFDKSFLGIGNGLNNVITGGWDDDVLEGRSGNDTLNGSFGHDLLKGDLGNDRVVGGAGNDTLSGWSGDDFLDGGTGKDSMTGGAGNDLMYGGDQNDVMDGGEGKDTLSGGTGADKMAGGDDDDVYYVDNVGDTVTESFFGGSDKVLTTLASYTLQANVDGVQYIGSSTVTFEGHGNDGANSIVVSGSAANKLYGEDGNDRLTSTSTGKDTLDGGTGADTMKGGGGNDTYYVDNADDVVFESTSAGNDTVKATANAYELSGNIENLHFIGTGDFVGEGNYLDNVIIGGSGNDQLFGGLGYDYLTGGDGNDKLWDNMDGAYMAGGKGDDTYVIVDPDSTVSEQANQGIDTVELHTFVSAYALGANVENAVFTGNSNATLNGNDLANALTGNKGNDAINGFAGDDILKGLAGNDTLWGGADNDVLDGGAGADKLYGSTGVDTASYADAWSSVTVDLESGTGSSGSANGDVLIGIDNVTGSHASDYLYGDDATNVLNGGDAQDRLEGRGGADVIDGGAGVDTASYASSTAEVAVDLQSGVAQYGDAEGDQLTGIENLSGSAHNDVLLGNTEANDLFGGSGNDRLNGRAGNDTLHGVFGNDTINGGAGDDFMSGGTGNDVFIFSGQWGADMIVYFENGADKLQMVGLDMGDLTIEQVFSDTVISHGDDKIILSGVSMANIDASDFIFS